MIQSKPSQSFQLTEYETTLIKPEALPQAVGYTLWQQFDQQAGVLQVGFPSPKSNNCWAITPNGWVGFIQPTPDIQLQLNPRFPIQHIFELWSHAYGFHDSPLREQLTAVSTIASFQAILASWLAQSTVELAKKGFAKAYIEQSGELPYIKGRFHGMVPSKTAVSCTYHTLTTNITDNQIIAYTLDCLSRTQTLPPPVQTLVRKATHLMRQIANATPIEVRACYGRNYNRLNQHYRPIHQLCGFFLEQISPNHATGAEPFPSFLIHMPTLFERFVAQWLTRHLPPPWTLNVQETVAVHNAANLRFRIDMVLYNAEQQAMAVLDTKYKWSSKIAAADVHQLVTYAKLKQCHHAILVYPSSTDNLNLSVDDIHLAAYPFALQGDIHTMGQTLLDQIFTGLGLDLSQLSV